MQVTKAYAGTLAGSNVSSSRPKQFGNTKNLAGYWDKIDFINQTIADFLKEECGVEAAYPFRTPCKVFRNGLKNKVKIPFHAVVRRVSNY